MITFSLNQIPFSLAGSFLTITTRPNTHRLLYRTCSHRAITEKDMPFSANEFFEISLNREGIDIPYSYTAQPHRLDLQAEGGGRATLAFADTETLVFETEGVTLRLLPCKPFAAEFTPAAGQVCLVDLAGRGIHHLYAAEGSELKMTASPPTHAGAYLFQDTPRSVEFLGCQGAIRFIRYEDRWEKTPLNLEGVIHAREKEFNRWQKHIPTVPDTYQLAAEMAWFLLWNNRVPVSGSVTRPAIYMSKSWMNAIWAWDNCFNALAIAPADPEMAWNQLLLFFDHQDPQGMVPDRITDLEPIYCFTKPPIHGWTIRKLVNQIGLKKSIPYLEELYKPLSRLTDWWYTYRDFDRDGMCQYHHGNDSGWDNATTFEQGFLTEGADLAAHLVLQSEGLSYMAEVLDKKVAALRWQKRAEWQLKDLLKQGVKNNRFFSSFDGQENPPEPSASLINYIPMILGHRLPKRIRNAIIADLGPSGPFLTEHGLATEAPQSPKYQSDGYWRGPIWAPSTYMIFDGLLDVHETQLARTIAERFCNMFSKDPVSWENFDALTGQGLRCPGYSWTAAVFLLLAGWLAEQPKNS